jgi:23S rRNA (uracil1939-C5)-methyltransferase
MTCQHFGICGGCSCVTSGETVAPPPYTDELAAKESRVRGLLASYEVLQWRPMIGSPDIWHYRNKMEYAFAAPYKDRPSTTPSPLAGEGPDEGTPPLKNLPSPSPAGGEGFVLGLRQQGRYDRVVDLQTCNLVSPECFEILKRVRQWAKASSLTGYHRKAHVGDLRYLVIREAQNTGQRMVVLIASKSTSSPAAAGGGSSEQKKNLMDPRQPRPPVECSIDGAVPTIEKVNWWTGQGHSGMTSNKALQDALAPLTTTAWLGLTDTKSDVARAEEMTLLWGPGTIDERLGDRTYRISPYSFFQTNTHGTERLYGLLAEWGKSIGGALVDVYCGSGGITLALAQSFDRVVGIDTNREAIEDARFNAEHNGIGNAEFVAEDAVEFLKKLPASKLAVQLSAVIVDPPRPGLHPKALQALLELNPPRLAYVSCNPESLARDLQGLVPFYKILSAQPVDLFPHTPHVETVVFLEHR